MKMDVCHIIRFFELDGYSTLSLSHILDWYDLKPYQLGTDAPKRKQMARKGTEMNLNQVDGALTEPDLFIPWAVTRCRNEAEYKALMDYERERTYRRLCDRARLVFYTVFACYFVFIVLPSFNEIARTSLVQAWMGVCAYSVVPVILCLFVHTISNNFGTDSKMEALLKTFEQDLAVLMRFRRTVMPCG